MDACRVVEIIYKFCYFLVHTIQAHRFNLFSHRLTCKAMSCYYLSIFYQNDLSRLKESEIR